MFTGIVEGRGKVLRVEYRAPNRRLAIEFPFHLTDVQLGDSISINGVCLTIMEKENRVAKFELSEETDKRSSLGELKEGNYVNLERSLRPTDRLGGHFVTGHIDGVGVIVEKKQEKDFAKLRLRVTGNVSKYVVSKGSIAIDGVSLTVNECRGEEILLTLIPYTLEKTTLMEKKAGDSVNVEADILGKYVEKLLNLKAGKPEGLDLPFLREHGFLKGDEGSHG
jgi:riboflavin synthase